MTRGFAWLLSLSALLLAGGCSVIPYGMRLTLLGWGDRRDSVVLQYAVDSFTMTRQTQRVNWPAAVTGESIPLAFGVSLIVPPSWEPALSKRRVGDKFEHHLEQWYHVYLDRTAQNQLGTVNMLCTPRATTLGPLASWLKTLPGIDRDPQKLGRGTDREIFARVANTTVDDAFSIRCLWPPWREGVKVRLALKTGLTLWRDVRDARWYETGSLSALVLTTGNRQKGKNTAFVVYVFDPEGALRGAIWAQKLLDADVHHENPMVPLDPEEFVARLRLDEKQ